MEQSRVDEARRALESLKTFDMVHELRMINVEKEMDCPGTGDTQDMIIEKFKAFHGNLFSVIEGLFGMVVDLESQLKAHTEDSETTGPTLLDIVTERHEGEGCEGGFSKEMTQAISDNFHQIGEDQRAFLKLHPEYGE